MTLALATLLILTGCVADDNEAPFAFYSATGKRTKSCGDQGLLASPEAIEMRVTIRLVGGSGFHWDHGDGLSMGTFDNAGGFFVTRFLRVDTREGDEAEPDCVIDRRTVIEGVLVGNPDPDGTYETFDGEMRFEYEPYDPTSECSHLLEGEDRIADTLPCTVSYDIEGARD